MPEICRFLGIVIAMHYNEHYPPHFHARYGENRASFSIEKSLKLLKEICPKGWFLLFSNGRLSIEVSLWKTGSLQNVKNSLKVLSLWFRFYYALRNECILFRRLQT